MAEDIGSFKGDGVNEERINPPSLVEIIRERLIEDILKHTYLPGQKVPIMEVAQRYGVSETPVKQAFSRLVSEGLLETLPRRGVIVRQVTKEDVKELSEARAMFGSLGIEPSLNVSAERKIQMDAALVQILSEHKAFLTALEPTITIEDYLRYVELDRAFHCIFIECIENKIILGCFNALKNQSTSMISLSPRMVERWKQVYEEHLVIYQAWQDGYLEGLKNAFKEHSQSALKSIGEMKDLADSSTVPTRY